MKLVVEDIEKVEVNGMKMYKLGNELFLKFSDAVDRVEELNEYNLEAKQYPFDPNYDPKKLIREGHILHGVILG